MWAQSLLLPTRRTVPSPDRSGLATSQVGVTGLHDPVSVPGRQGKQDTIAAIVETPARTAGTGAEADSDRGTCLSCRGCRSLSRTAGSAPATSTIFVRLAAPVTSVTA